MRDVAGEIHEVFQACAVHHRVLKSDDSSYSSLVPARRVYTGYTLAVNREIGNGRGKIQRRYSRAELVASNRARNARRRKLATRGGKKCNLLGSRRKKRESIGKV